ncbi:hypothetical protein OYE22_12515 [Streptomyces sp. 71268]|uniref:hypothetical protein n=1 Tax=Streptomyces sp. 71268 TaxID=3002640 RepID=UPI0023F69043|nr:hypothetical protein [Streptomyces sp. 71268]WEV25927.1 hypothetical protein OYE22_12515 [Streptomyces sp. 71268]
MVSSSRSTAVVSRHRPPPPAPQGNAGLALLAGVAAALVGGVLYAFLLSALADTDGQQPEITQFAYAGVALGALVGFVVAKLGGRNQGLWIVGAVFALIAVFLGEMYGYALVASDFLSNVAERMGGDSSQAPSANDLFFDHFGDLYDGWKEDADAVTYIFMALSPIAAYGAAHKLSNR